MTKALLLASIGGGSFNPPAPSVPGAPTGVSAAAGDASATVTWTAPASNGGANITNYEVTPYIGASAQAAVYTGSAATSKTVTGLTNGTAYTFKVAAINSAGTGAQSSASAAVTPSATARPWALPVTTATVAVSGVDDTGATDCTSDLQAFIDGVPDGRIITFGGPTKTYKISRNITLIGRNHLILDGEGATINNVANANNGTTFPSPHYSRQASTFYWSWIGTKPTHLTFRNFVAEFASPSPGVFQSGEHAAFLHAMGGSYLEVDNVTMSGLFGDMVTLNEDPDHVWVHDCDADSVGRHMLSIMCGSDIIMERCTAGPSGYGIFDIEPEAGSIAGISNVWFRDNTAVSYVINTWVSIDGVNAGKPISNINITDNVMTGIGTSAMSAIRVHSVNGTTSRVQDLTITGNEALEASTLNPVMQLAHIDGLTVTGNTQPLSGGGTLMSVSDCTDATTSPNP